jgi:hypothetical protein
MKLMLNILSAAPSQPYSSHMKWWDESKMARMYSDLVVEAGCFSSPVGGIPTSHNFGSYPSHYSLRGYVFIPHGNPADTIGVDLSC